MPEILPTLLYFLYGAGGDGKSIAAWALAKHISLGLPFETKQCRSNKKGKI